MLFSYIDDIDPRVLQFVDQYSDRAKFFFYEDTRTRRNYLSSIRPHIIKKHFDYFPELENEDIFYHDADIIFRQIPDYELMKKGQSERTWYLSNSNEYIGLEVLNSLNPNIIHDLCHITNVNPEVVFSNYFSFGGAQHILRKVSSTFWNKHEHDCEEIYDFLSKNLEKYKEEYISATEHIDRELTRDFKALQVWCSDMWSLVLNAHFFKFKIVISKELDFCWPYQNIDHWNSVNILHNAGVFVTNAHELFYKGHYKEFSPFKSRLDYVNKEKCSYVYVQAILETIKARRYKNSNVVIFLLIRIDSDDRRRNVDIFLKYMEKHFNFSIVIWEVDNSRKYFPKEYESLSYTFIKDETETLYRTKYFNRFMRETEKNIIGYMDCDCFVKTSSIIESIEAIESDYTLALPFDNNFINIVDDDAIKSFDKDLELNLLIDTKNQVFITNSVGGGVFVNKPSYTELGGENESIVGWGIDDLDRVFRVLIDGRKVHRAKGDLYHLHHTRPQLSSQELEKNVIAFVNSFTE